MAQLCFGLRFARRGASRDSDDWEGGGKALQSQKEFLDGIEVF